MSANNLINIYLVRLQLARTNTIQTNMHFVIPSCSRIDL